MSGHMEHLSEEQLHDAAEVTDPLRRGAVVGEHLARCGQCREDVERIRSLLATVATLPRSVEPHIDLWPAIRAQVTARPSEALPVRRAATERSFSWLAAAAVLLIIATATLTTLIVRDEPAQVAGGAELPAAAHGGATPGSNVSDDYDHMDRAIAAQLAGQRDKLQPETIEKVERNLLIIDRAIGEIRQAMAEDPGNAALKLLLEASYGQKAALVRQVSQS